MAYPRLHIPRTPHTPQGPHPTLHTPRSTSHTPHPTSDTPHPSRSHTPHPTPHTPHPTPHAPHPAPTSHPLTSHPTHASHIPQSLHSTLYNYNNYALDSALESYSNFSKMQSNLYLFHCQYYSLLYYTVYNVQVFNSCIILDVSLYVRPMWWGWRGSVC